MVDDIVCTFTRLSTCNTLAGRQDDMYLLHLATGLIYDYFDTVLFAKDTMLTVNYALTEPALLFGRQHSSSPAPRGNSPVPVTAVSSRKQKSSNHGLHRQAVVAQAVRANAQSPNIPPLQDPHGSVVSEANGQGSAGSLSQKAAQGVTGSKGDASEPNDAAPERTSSGRMLNPFASTFIPHSNSSSMLSTSATSSQ